MQPIPNYVDPPTRPPAVEAISCTFIVLVVLTLALRLHVGLQIRKSLGLDDVLAAMGMVSCLFEF